MRHYLQPGIAKALAIRIVNLRIKLGLITVKSPKEYRDAVVKAAHSAWMDLK